ncbi:MAG: ATP-binding cassette domain-containing protein [Acetobacteraceae bacterium]|nr:ATP-binding cassette domain-containing protein [Acetobacteraceae bacterium]
MPALEPFLSLSAISKRYGGVQALANVDFSCRRGSIHAVLGENGAGKSTLIKIIAWYSATAIISRPLPRAPVTRKRSSA